ncbi:hypothetical protein [Fructobacillus tropaeoli]|uniref:Uncharacterized protein n=1 Tax=Fructobacillus tropaeoli TaxID=709323 RepID=A0A3F3GWI9_9LACO|nr:hypothetical protein [Fructobacillus tropaeoli]GAP03615.1 hypothetical protein FTRO_0011600 [Fructobacillus tropaeoli]
MKTTETIAEPIVSPTNSAALPVDSDTRSGVQPSTNSEVEEKTAVPANSSTQLNTDKEKAVTPVAPSVEPKADKKETAVPVTPSIESNIDKKEAAVLVAPSAESKIDKKKTAVPANQTSASNVDDKQVATPVKISDNKLAQPVVWQAEITKSNVGAQELLTHLSENSSATAKDSQIQQKQETTINQNGTGQHHQNGDNLISALPKTDYGHTKNQTSVKATILTTWLIVLTGLGLIKKKYDDID